MPADDARKLALALVSCQAKPTNDSKRGVSLEFVAAVLAHVLAIAAMALVAARFHSAVQIRIARGNPQAQDGASRPSAGGPDQAALQPISITPQQMPTPHEVFKPGAQISVEDVSSLPDRIELPTAALSDFLIGIGSSAAVPAPHFPNQ